MTRPEYSDDGSIGLVLPLDLDPSPSTSRRLCAWCEGPIPSGSRRDAIYCATRCRQASHRFGRGMIRAELTGRPISVAYADPPYPGKASIYREHPDYAGEVDHAELVNRLVDGWPDGWALSTSAEALPRILRLCPDDVRVAAWLRGPRINTRALRPLASWEPVIYRGGRLKSSEALEQVDNVLPIWEEIASRLIVSGYSTWTGILSAEEYGVPQTRRRAILLASLDRQAHPPAPTHQAYRFGEPAEEVETLFGTLRPWVSMAEALGWDDDVVLDRRQTGARLVNTSEAPSPTLTATAVGKGVWAFSRPSTTIAGDPRAFQPGSHHYAPGAQSQNALRLELSEGLILQGFPADYPVAGSTKRSRWLQVGNAVPPPLAAAILDTLTR